MTATDDVYSDAIAYLTAHPEQIQLAWADPYDHPAGCLFTLVDSEREDSDCGCLTQIKFESGLFCAATAELTAAIRADDRIPNRRRIMVSDLGIFAEWQRHIDDVLGRQPPQVEVGGGGGGRWWWWQW